MMLIKCENCGYKEPLNKELFVKKAEIVTNPDLTEEQIVEKLKEILNNH